MKNRFYFLLILLGVLTYSCENAIEENGGLNVDVAKVLVTKTNPIDEVDINVVKQVAAMYGNMQGTQTRNNEEKAIEAVIPVKNEKGDVLMYVVNYAGNAGYVILSGKKEYQPILAYSETGRLDLQNISNTGLSLWMNESLYAIENSGLLPDSIRFQNERLWNRSFERKVPFSITSDMQTRSVDPNLEYQVGVYIEESLQAWSDAGYMIYPYGDGSILEELFPAYDIPGIKQSIEMNADDRFFGGFESTVYILKKEEENRREYVAPMLKSEWGQENGYNSCVLFGFPVGCVAVAIGQIMRYHEYPNSFNWSEMPYTYATDATANLLFDIGQKANIVYGAQGSGTSIENSCKALKKYGYTESEINSFSSNLSVKEQMEKHWPVCMFGTNKKGKGHAWVCDGFSGTYINNSYKVMVIDKGVFDHEGYPYYRDIHSQNVHTIWELFHMNWGSYGDNDGFYQNVETLLPEAVRYTNNMKIIRNIHP